LGSHRKTSVSKNIIYIFESKPGFLLFLSGKSIIFTVRSQKSQIMGGVMTVKKFLAAKKSATAKKVSAAKKSVAAKGAKTKKKPVVDEAIA
jgi:hypothetical protein